MNDRRRLVFTLLFAFLAAFATYRYLIGLRETTRVVIASTEIPAGTQIEPSMLSSVVVGKREQELLVPRAIRDPEQVVGRAPKRTIHKGAVLSLDPDDFVLSDEALKQVTGGTVPPGYLVPQGQVAVAVSVDADSSVGYQLQKGDRVHVLATWKQGDEVITRTFLYNAQVFEVGRLEGGIGGGDRSALRTVTLLVHTAEAEKVVNAKRAGKVDLVLAGRQEP